MSCTYNHERKKKKTLKITVRNRFVILVVKHCAVWFRAMYCSIVPCRALPRRTVTCRTVPRFALPRRALLTAPCRVYRAVPCRALPRRAVPCRAVHCRAVPYLTNYEKLCS